MELNRVGLRTVCWTIIHNFSVHEPRHHTTDIESIEGTSYSNLNQLIFLIFSNDARGGKYRKFTNIELNQNWMTEFYLRLKFSLTEPTYQEWKIMKRI